MAPTVRLYSRNAYDSTERLAAIAAAAQLIKAESFTIDGEAVVLGPDGLSRFDELSRREAARTAILYAFDLIELDGEDLRPSDTNVTALRPAVKDRTAAERSRRYRRKRKAKVREVPAPLPVPVTPVTRHGGRGVTLSTTVAAWPWPPCRPASPSPA